MSHTPGPWFMGTVQQDEHGFELCSVGPFEAADHYEDSICDVSGVNHPCEENARLIAAAPELLAALKMVAAGPCDTHCVAGFEEVSAAIAKAEGR